MCDVSGHAPGNVAEALRMAGAALDFLNSPAAAELDGASCGPALTALGELHSKVVAARAGFLRRFDAADGHDADGYGSSSAWLAARTGMTPKAAKAAVRQMRQFTAHQPLHDALAAAALTESLAAEVAAWTGKLPADLRAATDKVLADAAAGGATREDLAVIAAAAYEKWRSQQPDSDDDNGFEDRYLALGATFGGAGVIRGDLTPECSAAVQAVLEALGKRHGPEDMRSEAQRFHDALQLGCELLIRAKMVPDRAGADTRVEVHIPLSQLRQMPGASALEQAWLNAHTGEAGYLTGKDAEAAACDSMIIPVVTGHADMQIIDQIIDLALAACDHGPGQDQHRPLSPRAWAALQYAIARLAIDYVSGPNGLASTLRTGLLQAPYNTPSLPLDVGYSDDIPAHIRRAVILRDKRCAWPGCGKHACYCDVHHIVHKEDGGKTSVSDCILLCQFHHDICIHRWNWQIVLHPDGTTSAYGPNGQILHSHSPPTLRAGYPAVERIATIRLVKYFEEARSLWQRHVPPYGQADTVQGELIRAVEKLRDEAQRNGNLNWGAGHVILSGYIRTQLIGSGIFTGAASSEIAQDINRILDFERPETSDEPYDRLTDRIVEWSRAHPEPVPHEPNPALRI